MFRLLVFSERAWPLTEGFFQLKGTKVVSPFLWNCRPVSKDPVKSSAITANWGLEEAPSLRFINQNYQKKDLESRGSFTFRLDITPENDINRSSSNVIFPSPSMGEGLRVGVIKG